MSTGARVVVYVVLVAVAAVSAADALVYDMTPKNGCRVYLADDDPHSRGALVVETAILADVPWGSTEYKDGRIIQSTVPYDGDPCDEPALDQYETDEYELWSYANTGGPLRVTTFLMVGLVVFVVGGGWWASGLVVAGMSAVMSGRPTER